jgi:hypothetical protein
MSVDSRVIRDLPIKDKGTATRRTLMYDPRRRCLVDWRGANFLLPDLLDWPGSSDELSVGGIVYMFNGNK